MSELSVGQLKGLTVNNNIVTVPSGHTIYAPGSVIQTKYVQYSTVTTYTSSTYTTISSISITPKKSNSIFLIGFSYLTSGMGGYTLTKNGSTLWIGPSDGTGPFMIYQNPSNQTIATSGSERQLQSFNYFDSPNTTSTITYTVGVRPYSTSNAAYQIAICEGNAPGNFYVMEIAQ